MAKRTYPPCSKCGKAQGNRKGGLCSRCEKDALATGPERRMKVADLSPHPMNAGIYGDAPDPAFVANVKRNGILTALVVTPDGTIISGHKRWRAAMLAGLEEVPVVVRDLDEDRALEELVSSNLQRAKTNEQIGNEADALWTMYQRQSEARELAGKKADPVIPGSQGRGPATRDLVAEAIGNAGITVERAREVVRRLKVLEGDRATLLREELSRSVRGAWELVRSWDRPGMPSAAPDLPAAPQEAAPDEDEDEDEGSDGQPDTEAGAKPCESCGRYLCVCEEQEDAQAEDEEDEEAGEDDDEAESAEEPDTVLASGATTAPAAAPPDPAGLSPGPAAGGQEAPAARTPPPLVPVDPQGIPLALSPGAVEVFEWFAEATKVEALLDAARKRLPALVMSPAGAAIRRQLDPQGKADLSSIHSVELNLVLSLVRGSTPVCSRCPYCHPKANRCKECKGLPFVTNAVWAKAPLHLRQKLIADLAHKGPGAAAPRQAKPAKAEAGGVPEALPAALDTPAFRGVLGEWLQHRREQNKPATPTAVSRLVARCEKWGEPTAVKALEFSMSNGWAGVFPEHAGRNGTAGGVGRGPGQMDMDAVRADLEKMGLA